MNILVITREFPPHILGGISYHLNNLYQEIDDMGHDITVISGVCPQSHTETDEQPPEGIDIHPVQFGFRKGYYVLFPVALWNFMRGFDVDQFDVAMTHTQVPFDLGIPTVAKHHDCLRETRPYVRAGLAFHERLADSLMHPFRCRIDQHALDAADHAMFNSNLTQQGWARHYDFSNETSVVYNGVDRDIFYPRDDTFGDGPKSYILFVGGVERKGLSEVLSYAERAERPVYLVGPSQVDTPGATALGRVSQDELADIYSRAAVTIHPTSFEPFGNVVLESVACGTPVVTTEYCGAAEILDETCAVITNDIATGVRQAQELSSEDCIARARKYTWDDVATETISTVRKVL